MAQKGCSASAAAAYRYIRWLLYICTSANEATDFRSLQTTDVKHVEVERSYSIFEVQQQNFLRRIKEKHGKLRTSPTSLQSIRVPNE
jgi:hypothetical protein